MVGMIAAVGVWASENTYALGLLAIGMMLIAELTYSVAFLESLIIKTITSLYTLTEMVIQGTITWVQAEINMAAETIIRVKEKDSAEEIEKVKKKRPNDTIIYRLGRGTYKNLTPRPIKDLGGLSYQLTMPMEFPFTFTTKGLINETVSLHAEIDGPDHVSVYPTVISTMPAWIATRDTADVSPHPYSVILRNLSIRVG